MSVCTLCPRACGVDRTTALGYCRSRNTMRIARANLHYWEEPPISGKRGSGAIFFTGCSLRCVFCQNSEISSGEAHGRLFTQEEFIACMQALEKQGAHNINLVTPTHYAHQIAAALRRYKPGVPVVYNCGGYESVETLKMLEGLVDVYLPDFKYAGDALAQRVSAAPNYRETALAALQEMRRQVGENRYDEQGMLQKGMIIRHLILPLQTRNSMAVLQLLAEHFPGTPVSLMSQYTPMGRVTTDPQYQDLNRTITQREHKKVQAQMLALELPGFCQKRSAAGERYIPDFTQFDAKQGENAMQLQLISPLEKVFKTEAQTFAPYTQTTALLGEEVHLQVVVRGEGDRYVDVRTDAPAAVSVYRVGDVPCAFTAYPHRHDADYITTAPGTFPDVLYPLENKTLSGNDPETLWIRLQIRAEGEPGAYPVEISVGGKSVVFHLTVLPVALPPQQLVYTQWFYGDCIASLHGVDIYSEAHWQLLEKYMRTAAQHGMNMILTPVFTPALDTAIGTERPCTQLVEITKDGAEYRFDFSKLRRWVQLAKACGISRFEISHFFTQWGANCAPNIYVTENGERQLRFGWHTPATDPAYAQLLQSLIPQLLSVFAAVSVLPEQLMFHISDEPAREHMASYLAAKEIVAPLLSGYTIRDALSDFDFFREGVVPDPIVGTNHLPPFLAAEVPQLWCYYCCAQCTDVANRFFAMPAYRNRILGVQLWKYKMTGFLHWGYNFWYAAESRRVLNPFTETDADGNLPGGDAFSVYPGPHGPLLSTRIQVFLQAMQDLRALQLLESKIGYDAVLALLEEGQDMTFASYPRSAEYLLRLRQRVNARLLSESEKTEC